MDKASQVALEGFIDQYGTFAVLDCISGICGRKAEQTGNNIQWLKAEAIVAHAAHDIVNS